MSQIDRRLIIDASEVGEFVYCAKSWYLKRNGEVPQGSQLESGVVYHKEHGATVAQAVRLRKAGRWLALIGFLLVIMMALIRFSR
jgi:hypothetical protein